MSECLFCQIASKQIPAKIHFENDDFVAFEDINPKAIVHLLIVPKKHYDAMSSLKDKDTGMLGKLLNTARIVAEQEGIAQSGYRLVINSGKDSGMEVDHLHLHLLGGSQLNAIN